MVFNPFAVKGDPAVQCRLSAKGEHNAFGTFLPDHLLHKVGCHGKEVYLVGHAFRCLHGSDVGVDQDGFNALLFQGFECLGTGIIKFTGLTDLQGTGTKQQYFLYIVFFHYYNVFEFGLPQSNTEFHRDYFLLTSYKQEIKTL